MREYNFKINKINLKNGEHFVPNRINVVIGPNNAGKSKFLREIAGCFHDTGEKENYILENIEFDLPTSEEAFNKSYDIENKKVKDENGSTYLRTFFNLGNFYSYLDYRMNEEIFKMNFIDSNNYRYFLECYGCLFLNYLGTENRLTMIKKKENATNLHFAPNFISEIFNNSKNDKYKILEQLANDTKRIFNKDIVLDKETEPGMLSFRTGKDFSYYNNSLRSDSSVLGQLEKENILDNEGDGIKSFVSTYLSLKLDSKNIVLIDEPESFLHPPLARQLGEIIGNSATDDKQIFITTHSSEILKGILSTCKDVNVIRITRKENINTISELDTGSLKQIILTPRLRVSKVLDGLFCERVAITESEADEIFYQEFLEKINPQSGVFFTHVNSKSNICSVAEIYNKLNVENYMIFDFDILRVKDDFKKILRLLPLSDKEKNAYRNIRKKGEGYIENIVKAKSSDEKEQKKEKDILYHKEGINCISGDIKLKNSLENMIDELAENNVLILKNGELETNLIDAEISYTGNKNVWIENAIDYIDKTKSTELENLNIAKLVKKMKK